MNDRGQIVTLAESQIGKPYRHMERGPQAFDCLGLLLWIAEQIGFELPHVEPYSRNPSGRRMALALQQYARSIRISAAGPGDFLHMAFNRQPQHLAVLVAPSTIVHADSQRGRVVRHRLSGDWLEKVRAAYAFPELT